MKRISVNTKLDCLQQLHKEEEIKAICLNPECTQDPFLCALCLTQFKHSDCRYMIITLKEMRKKDIWNMENWPSNKEDMKIRVRLTELQKMKEVMELVDKIADRLIQDCHSAIETFRRQAKQLYPKLLQDRQFDVLALKQLFVESYSVQVPNNIFEDIINWKLNMYEATEALNQYRKSVQRKSSLSDMRQLNQKGKFMKVPDMDVTLRALKVINWQLKNLKEEIYGLKQVSRTVQFQKKIIEDEDGIYEGEVSSDNKNGHGIYFMKNGNKYEGDMLNGLMHGKGKYTWKNGNSYEGTFLKDKLCGFGKMSFSNGDLYEGEFVNNKATGEGKLITADGQVYQGSFHANLRQGYGTQFLKNGSKYQGEFFKGKWHGRGKVTAKNGRIEEGVWLDNLKQ